MDNVLWNKILQFNFDDPSSEFGFSIRLAKENFWTKNFTKKAILEYKKFMYLASVSDSMVSPSEIVDVVWHLHLIFTKSYQDFCKILEKQIQHIPSTHNREDFQKFKKAKEQTNTLYESTFGTQPNDIWEFDGMYESLNLDKAKINLRSFMSNGLIVLFILTFPFYFLLKPIYVTIDNPYFLIGFIILCLITLKFLDLYNKLRLRQIARKFDPNSFIYDLEPYELIYLKTHKMSNVINGVVNELIDNKIVQIEPYNIIKLIENKPNLTDEQIQVTASLKEFGKSVYSTLVERMKKKPAFINISNFADAFEKYFVKSKKFHQLFYTNFVVLAVFSMLGYIRLITGITRNKPVGLIVFVLIVFIITIFFFLHRLTRLFYFDTLTNLYKKEILPAKQIENNWQWNYFLFSTAVIAPAFMPLIAEVNKNDSYDSSSGSSSCGTSSDSSGSSSCGSSCGGCGGGD